MGLEIERKFLIKNDSWKKEVNNETHLRQGYLNYTAERTVRDRLKLLLLFSIVLLNILGCKNDKNSNRQSGKTANELNVNDSIPKIEFQTKGFVFPEIFEGSFESDTKVSQDGHNIEFYKKGIGQINISSGKIIATDPIALQHADPFLHEFPKGQYPVELAIAKMNNDERVAYVRIKFNQKKITNWKFALKNEQPDIPITSADLYGYGVDGGIGMFIDLEGRNYLNKLNIDDYWGSIFIDKFSEKHKKTWSYINHKYSKYNLVAFSSGYGDGYFGTYIGIDEEGEICQLLTDFGLINWRLNQ